MSDSIWYDNSRIRFYGTSGPYVILIHGGPAAYGDLRDMAEGLDGSFRIIEPCQRPSGDTPLTVSRHVEDLNELIKQKCEKIPPALVGHSWGAMLALVYAATYPCSVGPIALVGCGTFDTESLIRMKEILNERMDEESRQKVKSIEEEINDPDDRLVEKYKIIGCLQQYEHASTEKFEEEPFDKRGHKETWDDMVRLMDEGVYPSAFTAIKSPVIMLHGVYDPHPGRMIYANLRQFIPHLEYHEWERCGHYPWREKYALDDFFIFLRTWLTNSSNHRF